MRRPQIGETVLLVYRECPCGSWCATGEGDIAPRCGSCGQMMLPLGGLAPAAPQEDVDHLGRSARGLGFAAFFTNEIGAVNLLGRLRGFLGISKAKIAHEPFGNTSGDYGPYALEGEVDGDSFETVRTADDLMRVAMKRYRFGSKRKLWKVSDDAIVRIFDLRGGAELEPVDVDDPLVAPVTIITPFGDVLLERLSGDGGDPRVWRCTCPRDPDGPADQDHEVDPACPRHKRRHG